LTSIIFGEHHREFEFIKELQVIQDKVGEILVRFVPLQENSITNMEVFRERLIKSVKSNSLVVIMEQVKLTQKTIRGKHILLIQNLK